MKSCLPTARKRYSSTCNSNSKISWPVGLHGTHRGQKGRAKGEGLGWQSDRITPKSQQHKPLAISIPTAPAFAFLTGLFQLLIQILQTPSQPIHEIVGLVGRNDQFACVNPFVISFPSTIHNSGS